MRNLSKDLDDGSKDIAAAVCQQGGGLDVVHLGDFMVKLDEVGGRVLASDGVQAVFDDTTSVGL